MTDSVEYRTHNTSSIWSPACNLPSLCAAPPSFTSWITTAPWWENQQIINSVCNTNLNTKWLYLNNTTQNFAFRVNGDSL